MVKNPPAVQETWVQSLGWEDLQRRARQTTPVFWPGEFHGLYDPWGHREADMTERHSLKGLNPLGFPTFNEREKRREPT